MTDSGKTTIPIELTLHDIVLAKSIITQCTKRGAFNPDELESVGKLFSKLSEFIDRAVEAGKTANAAENSAQAPQAQ